MRKRYRVIKETPELKVGAILEEGCDQGDQDFICISRDKNKFNDQGDISYSRKTVMDQSEWFEEMYLFWIPSSEYNQVVNFLNKIRLDTFKG